VNYGTPAAKVACLLTSVANHPGTSGFVTQEYDSFTGFVDSVVPCAEATTTTAAAPATTTVTTTGIIQVRYYEHTADCTGSYLPTCGIKGTDLSECTDTVDNFPYPDGKIQIKCQTDGKAVLLYFPSSGCSESLWSDPSEWVYHIDMDTSNYAKARQGQCFQIGGESYKFLGDTQQFIFPTCKASTTEAPWE